MQSPSPSPLDDLKVFTGNANPALAGQICESLGTELGRINVTQFADGESYCQIQENVRGKDVFVIQPTCPPVNHNLMELLVMMDAFKRASAARVTAVVPYYGYARQDRKDRPRVPISAKLVADLITAAGADRLLALDLHAAPIQAFFDIPVDHLFAAPVMVEAISKLNLSELTIVSPDAGGVERARAFAKRLDAGLAIMDKRREGDANVAKIMHVIGDVKDRTVFIVDDIVDTAGTMVETVEALRQKGVRDIYACITHPILSGPAVSRLSGSPLKKMFTTNTVPLTEEKRDSLRPEVLSVAGLLAEAIRRIHHNSSVSSLFV
ncbi:MAG: ribose-phosphate pyrophosphokinase [Acidobacteriota bacterium]